MNKFHAKSKCFAVVFLLLCAAIDLSAQSSWVVNTSPSPWGAYYGLPVPQFLISSGNAKDGDRIFYDYDSNGNRVLRYIFYDLRKVANIKGDEAIGAVAEKHVENMTIDATAPLVFPNPTVEYIYVQQDKTTIEGTLELYDSKGQLLKQQQATNANTIEVADLPQGFYLLVLRSGKSTMQWKINKI